MADPIIINPADIPDAGSPASTDTVLLVRGGVLMKALASAFGISGGGDTTAPTVSARNVQDADTIRVDYNENVNASTAGHVFNVNGTPFTPTSATAVDANTVDYNIAGTIVGGDVVTHNYTSQGAGLGTRDTAGNQLAAFTGQSVTNGLSGGSGYETETDAYLAANTGLSTPQKDAIDAFVVSLKSIGWTKFKAVYLPVWGSAAANKWNLVDPEDNDASYRLTFSGTVTHGTNFIKSDGSTGYARTYLNGSTALTADNCGMSFFVKNANLGGGNRALAGARDASLANAFATFLDITTSTFSYAFETGGAAEFVQEAFTGNPADRWISMSRTSSTLLSQYINGGSAVTNTNARVGTFPNQEIYLMAINDNGTADRFMFNPLAGENELQFFAIHEGLDSTASNNLRTAWNTLKTALGI